jgi:hypothetical protein
MRYGRTTFKRFIAHRFNFFIDTPHRMAISSFFHSLRSGYQSEIDDLTFDSDGKNVLRQRLTQRRKELKFLLKMIELSPEMVAVVLHQGMQFKSAAAMQHLLTHESDELPEWDNISSTITLTPWAQDIVNTILKEPTGAWFLTVAAGLEFQLTQPQGRVARSGNDDNDDESEDDEDAQDYGRDDDNLRNSDDDLEETDREAAEADWMEQQGFDRKDV